MNTRLIVLALSLTLTGCVNPYAKFYRETVDVKKLPAYIPPTGPLQIYSTQDFQKDTEIMARKGYFAIGNASFNADASKVNEGQLREQGAKVGAQVVLVSSKYTGTIQGAVPLTLPNNTTSYTNGTATAYGSGGVVNAYGNSTTTTYGTQTTMIPYTIQRSDFGAVFFAKSRIRTGIVVAPLDDEAHKRLGTNSGLRTQLVVDGSPAFNADVFVNDVVMAIESDKVQSLEQYKTLLDKYEGQTVTFHLIRDGAPIDKTFRIASFKDPLN